LSGITKSTALISSMAADLGEFAGDDTESHLRPKRLSFPSMGADAVPLSTSSPRIAPNRATPPHTVLSLDRPMLENFMSPSSSSKNSPGISTSRQFGGLDHDLTKLAQQVS
jgi:hypothetical protein